MMPITPARSVCAVAVLALAALAACTKNESASAVAAKPPAVVTAPTPVTMPPAVAALPEPVKKVLGKWLRADGGYVLELRGGDASGVLQAGYFNPKSINVSRAVWMQGGAGLQVAVELNDVGYPGSTYVLTYDASADRLAGQYTQPSMQQTFDVEFVRQARP
ncbi:MAG: hypothetical protein Q8N18_01620 [Opitutaceae bacterium]|nr:hypothetical protein [Opitutaceae bacterium]